MPLTAALAGDLSLFVDSIWSAGTALTESARRHLHSREADITVAVGEDAVARVAPAWRNIEQNGGAATPFQSLAFAQRTAEVHLRRGETPRIVVVHDSGRPAVVFPAVVGRWHGIPTLRFLGDPLIQYGDVIAAPDVSPKLLETAWRAATQSSGAWLVHLRKVRDGARIASTLARTTSILAEYECGASAAGSPKWATSGSRRCAELRPAILSKKRSG